MKRAWVLIFLAGMVALAAPDEKSYQQALSHIDSKDYPTAVKLLKAEIMAQSGRAAGAMYWSAYAFNKMGDRMGALQMIKALEAFEPRGQWMSDARALQLEIEQASGKKISPEEQADEDLKLMAIQGLMHADPEKSLPLLEQILTSNKSLNLKKKAIFVLSQSGNPKAQEMIGKIAKGTVSPELQKVAIHNLGIGGKRNGAILEDVYKSASDIGVKKEVLHSFMLMGERDRLLALAKAEKNEELRSGAIHWLGIAGGRTALTELYGVEQSPKVRREILNGLFISGSAKELVQVARAEKDLTLKKEAVRYLSMMRNQEAADYMAELLK
jgi:HEAT repeat protein